MSKEFSFTEEEVKVLTNFVGINEETVINPSGFSVVNARQSMMGYYAFEDEKDFEKFGIAFGSEFLNLVKGINNNKFKVTDTSIDIIDVGSAGKGKTYNKIRYNLTPLKLLPNISSDVPKNFDKKANPEIIFTLTAENFAKIKKVSSVLKLEKLFILNNTKGNLQLIVGSGQKLDASTNIFEINISDEFIESNGIEDDEILVFRVDEIMKPVEGEYKIKISKPQADAGISHWHNNYSPSIDYYIGLSRG